tara:strand:- start:20 stop:1516 length:1497 start_codon:yes stop_codon:yes gene_type:complete
MKLLMELRPAGDGYSGIPQETRLLFSSLLENENLEMTGLLNNNRSWLGNSISKTGSDNDSLEDLQYFRSENILSLADSERVGRLGNVRNMLGKALQIARLTTRRAIKRPIHVHDIDMSAYADFLWRMYFAKSLPVGKFDAITQSRYAAIKPSWSAMHSAAMTPLRPGHYAGMDTSDYDVFLSQTPWPASVSKHTQLLLRYHDAIPVLYPHTIQNPRQHQFSHYFALRFNLKQGGIAVCNSRSSRDDLVKMFPQFESQTTVIPCMVSDQYYAEPVDRKNLIDIIATSIEPKSEPVFGNALAREEFYARVLKPENFRYLLMVSTIEPRKNHSLLISAWNRIRMENDPDLKLILVGNPGWAMENVMQTMEPFRNRGMLFNNSQISASDLRRLYNGAEAVVCPSVAEGFDLSGIEAMLSGGKVAASDIPVHREIYKDACEYFNPYSTEQAVDAIRQIIMKENQANRARLIERGGIIGAEYKGDKIQARWEILLDGLKAKRSG